MSSAQLVKKPVTVTQPKQREQRSRWQSIFPYVLIGPALILTIWILYPFVQAVIYSLQFDELLEPGP